MQASSFERARTQEQRAFRRQQILEATRILLAARRSHAISLGDIARESGLAKSAILRYFSSRETLLLCVLADEHAAWTGELLEGWSQLPQADPYLVAQVMAQTALERHVLCELLGSLASVLEHNVPVEDVISFKHRIADDLDQLHPELDRLLGPWPAGALPKAIVGVYALVHQGWEITHPAPALVEARRRDPRIPPAPENPTQELTLAIAAWLKGLLLN